MQKRPIFFGYYALLEVKFSQAKSLGLERLAGMELPYHWKIIYYLQTYPSFWSISFALSHLKSKKDI